MNVQELTEYCTQKLGSVLDYPFGPDSAVFKVGSKMFALLVEDGRFAKITLKCDPLRADFLRQQYTSVTPGYYMNKTHWNTVLCDGSIPNEEIYRQIDHSYDLIWKSLTKKARTQLEAESHPMYLFPDEAYQPLEPQEGDELYPNGIFIFNITRLLNHIAKNPDDYSIEIVKVADHKPQFSMIEHEKCAFADLQDPIILAEIAPGRYNVIDGNHRINKACHEGVETLHAYKLPPKQHSLFITKQNAYDTYLKYWNEKLKFIGE